MTFEQIINFYGSQAAAARALSLSQPSIHGWKKKGVPLIRQQQFEAITHGQLKADPIVIPRGEQ